jgi:hypothetical protein
MVGRAVVACIVVSLAEPAAAQETALATVLARAGAYVREFQTQLSGIVAEETYVQDEKVRSGTALSETFDRPQDPFTGRTPRHRELKSDLLLVKPVGADRWIQFRDVFEVDHQPIRDRSERLMKLFIEPSSSTKAQAERIVEESTRYNIGNLQRTVNVPVLALVILDPDNQWRFRFKRVEARSSTDSTWVIQYEEVKPQTMIRAAFNRDMPTHGRFWIEPRTGRVLRSELTAQDIDIRGTVEVSYQPEPQLGLLVPVEMREHYDIRRDGSRVDGIATYGRFRQFQVKVDEKLEPIKK